MQNEAYFQIGNFPLVRNTAASLKILILQNESNYIDLNWDQPDLENTIRTSFHAALGHPRWLQLEGSGIGLKTTHTLITCLPQRIVGHSSWLHQFNPKMN